MDAYTSFSEWLLLELKKREWSQADLARAAQVSRSAISEIISGRRQVGKDTANAIAEALKIPPEHVFRAAGILPSQPDADPWVEEMDAKLRQLSPELRDLAARVIESIIESEEAQRRRGKSGSPKNRSARA